MLPPPPAPLRLTVDLDAVAANYRWLAARSAPAATGAALKADAYGLGASAILPRLAREGCRDVFVATWAEARTLLPFAQGIAVHVLHGLLPDELPTALALPCTPVLNTPETVALWREAAPTRPCDLMVDTGINRLGLTPAEAASLGPGLAIDIAMSHLACADQPDHPMNARQLAAFTALDLPARRRSLANSAGICLGPDYALDLTRPGIALCGGITHPQAQGGIAPVVALEARVLQLRTLEPGETVGYGATWTARAPTRLAILNLGYADGYLRGFSNRGRAFVGGTPCPVVGRVSMDLTAVDVTHAPLPAIGDWVELDFGLPAASHASGLSQYELLTVLGSRFERRFR